jgi:hypothetical protein
LLLRAGSNIGDRLTQVLPELGTGLGDSTAFFTEVYRDIMGNAINPAVKVLFSSPAMQVPIETHKGLLNYLFHVLSQ